MKKIVVIGEILVEIMADRQGDGFLEPMPLTGPYPSGAPAIFADQAAKLGQPCALVSAVGDDDFGRLNLDRLGGDGVDVSAVTIDPNRPTGSAFVRYRPDGSRGFVFNITHSACGQIAISERLKPVLATADHLHIMGSSLSSADFVTLNIETAQAVRARGGTVSFDPNLRKEILDKTWIREAMDRVLAQSDIFLPSGEELTLLTRAQDEQGAIAELLDRGVGAIIHKQGAAGARYCDAERDIFVPALVQEEVDPTGAGDCFGAAAIVFWLRGGDAQEILTWAVAAGARAVTKRGPMEGTSDLRTLQLFIAHQKKADP